MMIRPTFLTMMVALLGNAWIPVASAQIQQPPAEQFAPSYSDSELKSFAVAALQVQRINDAYLPKLKAANSPEEQQQVKQAASQEMVQAVQKEGMSVEKYKEIAMQVQTNPQVAERVKQHIRNAQ